MKIYYISVTTFPSRSADSIQVMRACDSLAGFGHDVILHVPYRKAQDTNIADIFQHYRCCNRFQLKYEFTFFGKEGAVIIPIGLKAALSRVDIVISRSIPAAFITTLLGKPTVIEIHEPLNRSRIADLLSRWIVRMPSLKGVITNCKALEDVTLKDFPILHGKTVAIQNGADDMEDALLAPIARTKINIGYSGQLYKGKGMEIILSLAPRFPDYIFHVLGGLEEDINAWRKELVGIENIIFHGFINQNDLPSYLKAFDIVLAPYQKVVFGFNAKNNLAQWTSPMKVFDYMAAGRAIIASDLPFMREILTDGENALLCPPDDIEVWADALKQLVSDENRRASLATSAHQKFLCEYTWAKRAEKVLSFIRSDLPTQI